MGNRPPSCFHVATQYQASNGSVVSISTRSEPIVGFHVIKECGMVFANSQSYGVNEDSNKYLVEAISLLVNQAAAQGANAVLSVAIEVKVIAQGGRAQVTVYGTAVVVAPK